MAAQPCQSPGEVASVRAAVQAQVKELTASADKAVKELPGVRGTCRPAPSHRLAPHAPRRRASAC